MLPSLFQQLECVQNTPLFLKSFGYDDAMKLQLAIYASLDIIEERAKGDLCLGLLCPVDDLKVCVHHSPAPWQQA